MSIGEDTARTARLIESLLESISEKIIFLASKKSEKKGFLECACYFYRVSVVLMEIQTAETESVLISSTDILESLSDSIDEAKNIIEKYQESNGEESATNLSSSIEEELEGIVKQIGENLQSIPESTFDDQEYAGRVVQSLSKEMLNAKFGDSKSDIPEIVQHTKQTPSGSKTLETMSEQIETDLYPTDPEVSYGSCLISSESKVTEIESSPSQSTYNSSQRNYGRLTESLSMLPQVTQFIEPPYQAFICPLTKEIMEDPVTIETGITCERKAVTEWFERFINPDEIYCPVTGQKLKPGVSSNIALKTIIEEWISDKVEVVEAALSAICTLLDDKVDVEKSLSTLSEMNGDGWKEYNKVKVCEAGILQLLDKFLVYRDKDVRYEVLELLHKMAEDSNAGKEMIARTINISCIIKLLPSSHQQLRHAALLVLLELSTSQHACERIGTATGGILMLITSKYNRDINAFASETAEQILKQLEKFPDNIKRMAENGLLEPLLNHLAEGTEDVQVAMATYLVEIVIGHDKKTYVAEKASPALIRLVQSENTEARRVAFKALAQISLYHPNSQILVESGIVKIMVEEMFTKRMFSDLMNSRNEAATVLANILESGLAHEGFQVNTHGHTLASDYFVYNIIHMLKNSSPDELNIDLIRILLSLSKSSNTMATIVSVIKETDASFALIELINNPHEDLGVEAIKLLIALSPYIGHTLSERLCKTRGLPENLIQCPTEASHILERHAVSAKFLAKLPQQNLTLNLALVSDSVVSKILNAIHLIQRSGTRTSRYATDYLEGLVGILARFTATLYEPQMLYLAINHNLTSVFAELLMKTSSDEVQRLSATGLENLSSATPTLSRPPQTRSTKFMATLSMPRSLSIGSSRKKQIQICPIHRGVCSSKSTFCLVEANTVTKLVACLQSDKVEVVEAALSAICTLLDDKVDVEKSLSTLSEMNVVQHVLDAVKEHKKETLLQKAFWMIDKFLTRGGDKYALGISQDRMLTGMLVGAFHREDGNTREMAENILRRLDKMPSFSTYIV
ncbi:PREDICTED: putative U-box domain-containing protein 42 [Tarenaya hassleriana]|uniref:putative U-box domain-containing protein 42 n=1 Tax=Tarenaya hassleriana TaxID=28532 RepID=UPI00053C98FB|nr:PREDICTED: putative U-box domain-containing protein 42 [Tarenaya hassleriana]